MVGEDTRESSVFYEIFRGGIFLNGKLFFFFLSSSWALDRSRMRQRLQVYTALETDVLKINFPTFEGS